VSLLGDELDSIDRNEAHDLFLGCMCKNGNTARIKKLRELSKTLDEYGMCLLVSASYTGQCYAKILISKK